MVTKVGGWIDRHCLMNTHMRQAFSDEHTQMNGTSRKKDEHGRRMCLPGCHGVAYGRNRRDWEIPNWWTPNAIARRWFPFPLHHDKRDGVRHHLGEGGGGTFLKPLQVIRERLLEQLGVLRHYLLHLAGTPVLRSGPTPPPRGEPVVVNGESCKMLHRNKITNMRNSGCIWGCVNVAAIDPVADLDC